MQALAIALVAWIGPGFAIAAPAGPAPGFGSAPAAGPACLSVPAHAGGPTPLGEPARTGEPPAPTGEPAPASAPVPGDFDAWAEWWQAQRREYCSATPWSETDAGLGRAGDAAAVAELRSRASAAALAALGANEAALRRAAAIALGRLGAEPAVESLATLAQDGDASVRRAALVALGTAGGDRARLKLLAVAGMERPRPEATQDVGTALVALGLLRQGYADTRVDELVESRLAAAASLPPEIASAAVLHVKLARSEAGLSGVRALVQDEHVPTRVRGLAVEALAPSREARDFDLCAALLTHRDADLRRSAALALGTSRDPRAPATLLAAVEAERNLAARGFLVLSLGRLATEATVDRLFVERRRASGLDRAWAWLGLGLAARAGDQRARAALIVPADARLQAGEHAAALLAIGLARQVGAFELLARTAAATPETIQTPYAADGLALTATGAARDALAAGLERAGESSRPAFADGLARFGIASDAPALVAAWLKTATVSARRAVGLAVGRHGSRASIDALLAVALDPDATAADRATALEAASLALSRRPLDRLQVLASGANVLALEQWIQELAKSGL